MVNTMCKSIYATFSQCLIWHIQFLFSVQTFNFTGEGQMLEEKCHCSIQQVEYIACHTLII